MLKVKGLESVSVSEEISHFEREKLQKPPYTLVLDLDETLVHYLDQDQNGNFHLTIRPGVSEFLEELSKYYRIVVFTAAHQDYADWVIQ